MNWYESDQLDLAIMNPGPMAVLIGKYNRAELGNIFLGIRGLIPDKTSLAAKDDAGKDVTAPRSMYNSVMVLNSGVLSSEFSGKPTPTEDELFDFIMRKARHKQVLFLFVQPLSTSGYIYPRQVFLDEKIELDPTDYELIYSHDVSVKDVSKSAYDDSGRLNVAFVSDETRNTLNNNSLLTLRSGKMSTKIVQDALLLTPDFIQRQPKAAEGLKQLLLEGNGSQTFNLTAPTVWCCPIPSRSTKSSHESITTTAIILISRRALRSCFRVVARSALTNSELSR
jgi:ABC-type phosphate/phosphonate transport system substrate-binding protein